MEWAPVLKLLCGDLTFLKEVLDLGPKYVGDARLTNLRMIKQLSPDVKTIYMKPAPTRSIKTVVQYADVSMNTEFKTIQALNEESKKQDKIHNIIIMIELGDLREGIMGENLVRFYEKVFNLSNINVLGIGANLNCLSGVLPTQDKLIQMTLYGQLLEAKFDQNIPWISGGTSVILPMLLNHQVSKGVNHFRVGETLFFGTDLLKNGAQFSDLSQDVLKLHAEIIEVTEKPKVPIGPTGENPSGDVLEIDAADYGKTHRRAILDIGLLDVSKTDFLECLDPDLTLLAASSDMLVLDIENSKKSYAVGDIVEFKMTYMGALRAMNSRYIEKRVIE